MIRPHWKGDKLMQGKRYTPIEVLPDDQRQGMYRVHYQGKYPTWSILHARRTRQGQWSRRL